MWRRQKKKQMLTIITGACVNTTNLLGIYNRFWKDVHFAWCPQYFGSIVNLVVRLQSKKSTTLPQFLPCGKLQKQRWCYILCFLKRTCLKHVRATEDMLLRMIASETTQQHWKKNTYIIHSSYDEGFHSRHVGPGETKGRTNTPHLPLPALECWACLCCLPWLLAKIMPNPKSILVGGFNPYGKHISQLALLFPTYGKIKHVPNHQPVRNNLSCQIVGYSKFWSLSRSNRANPPLASELPQDTGDHRVTDSVASNPAEAGESCPEIGIRHKRSPRWVEMEGKWGKHV